MASALSPALPPVLLVYLVTGLMTAWKLRRQGVEYLSAYHAAQLGICPAGACTVVVGREIAGARGKLPVHRIDEAEVGVVGLRASKLEMYPAGALKLVVVVEAENDSAQHETVDIERANGA